MERVTNLTYLIVGDGRDREFLKALSERLGLRPYVHFLGHVKDDSLPGLYCASDLFVMPSLELHGGEDFEGFGIVFSEANACGLPRSTAGGAGARQTR